MNALPIIRQTLQLHTIDQWLRTDSTIRAEVLRNIKLKERLHRFMLARRKEKVMQPKWSPCPECKTVGHLLHEPRYDGIHPSQLPHPCMLKIFNEMMGIQGEEKIEARLLLIFDFGTALHKMFQGYGEQGAWGPHYKKEAPISGEFQELADALMIEGSADADNILIIEDIPGIIIEVGLIHEYKSINSNGFAKLNRPKPEHKTQAMVYSAALNRPVVVYMYMNKDTSNIADFPVPFEPHTWDGINRKAGDLVGYYERWVSDRAIGLPGTLPPANPEYHCQQCQYSNQCVPYREHVKKRSP